MLFCTANYAQCKCCILGNLTALYWAEFFFLISIFLPFFIIIAWKENILGIKQPNSSNTDNSNFHVFNTLIIIFCVCIDISVFGGEKGRMKNDASIKRFVFLNKKYFTRKEIDFFQYIKNCLTSIWTKLCKSAYCFC